MSPKSHDLSLDFSHLALYILKSRFLTWFSNLVKSPSSKKLMLKGCSATPEGFVPLVVDSGTAEDKSSEVVTPGCLTFKVDVKLSECQSG